MDRLYRRPLWNLPVFAGALAIAALASGAGALAQTTASVPANPARIVEMRHHFVDISLVQESVIRGDLASVRAPARRLMQLATPVDMPPASAPFITTIRVAARRAAEAQTLRASALAATTMLEQCGGCHQAVTVRPVPTSASRPDVGGLVGHMLEHQRAADQLLQGIVIPSATAWSQGVQALRIAPLKASEFPPDSRFRSDFHKAETEVHDIANDARADDAMAQRVDTYARLLTTCASCHSLHRRIWGPGTGQ
ncbi:MAG: hypothetical protein ABI634_09730 [Acidobacteriota bacterium]